MPDKPIREAPVFHDAERVAANRERGLVDGSAAIAAIRAKKDKRSNEELLLDLLCSLRFWAEESGVSFYEAHASSETHHMVENGKLAENYIRTLGGVNEEPPANVHEAKEFKFGQRVEVTSGPSWFGATGTIDRWYFGSDTDPSLNGAVVVTGAEIKLDPEWVGKLAGPSISVVVAKLMHLTILEQPPTP